MWMNTMIFLSRTATSWETKHLSNKAFAHFAWSNLKSLPRLICLTVIRARTSYRGNTLASIVQYLPTWAETAFRTWVTVGSRRFEVATSLLTTAFPVFLPCTHTLVLFANGATFSFRNYKVFVFFAGAIGNWAVGRRTNGLSFLTTTIQTAVSGCFPGLSLQVYDASVIAGLADMSANNLSALAVTHCTFVLFPALSVFKLEPLHYTAFSSDNICTFAPVKGCTII